MKKLLLVFVYFIYFYGYGQTPSNDAHWQIVWEDYFDSGTFLNPDNWVKVNDCDHDSQPTLLLEEYAYVLDGNLIIKLDKIDVVCPNPPEPNSYACGDCVPDKVYHFAGGLVESSLINDMQFGYLEAEIKMPGGKALWPAFWTYQGHSNTSHNHAEIDIMEVLDVPYYFDYIKNLPQDQVFNTNIFRCYDGTDPPYGHATYIDSYTNWHRYGIEWSPSRIIWYLDGSPIRVLANHDIIDPVRILLGMGIAIDKDKNPLDYSTTTFPSYMYVNYVKCYSLNKDCNDYINTTSYNFSTYNNIEKNFIKIGDGTGTNSLNIGDNITMRASQYIDICGDFIVPVGASLYLDANKDCNVEINPNCTQTFNPCTYDFSIYNNSVKRIIELGGNGCIIDITQYNNSILLESNEYTILKPGVTISSIAGKFVNLKHSICL